MSTDMSTDNNMSNDSSIGTKSNENIEEKSIKSESEATINLEKLNKYAEEEINKLKFKPFYKLNLLEIAIELKNTWFGILDDLLAGNMSLNIILKDNRLFYIGLTILIIAIILYIYDYAINPNDPFHNLISNNGNGVVEIRHIYEKR